MTRFGRWTHSATAAALALNAAVLLSLAALPASALEPAAHAALMTKLEEAGFSDDKMQVVSQYAGQPFTAEQAKQVLEQFTMSDDKMEALRLIVSGVPVDAADTLAALMMMSSDKDEARALIRSSGARVAATAPSRPVSPQAAPPAGTAAPAPSGAAVTVANPAAGRNVCATYALSANGATSIGVMTPERFAKMRDAVKAETFSEARMKALGAFLDIAPEGLSVAQVRELINWFTFSNDRLAALERIEGRITGIKAAELQQILKEYTFSNDRMRVLERLKDTLLDLDNRYDVLAAFDFQVDRDKARALLASIKGRTYLWGTVRAKQVVFVVDVSGSMGVSGAWPDGGRGTRLAFVQRELLTILDKHLESDVQFDIIAFESRARPWRGSLVAASSANLQAAKQFVASLAPSGGTNLYEALDRGFHEAGVGAMYLLTDGVPSDGPVTRMTDIQRAVLGWNASLGIPLHTVAMLTGGTQAAEEQQSRRFMFELAQQNCGQYRLVE